MNITRRNYTFDFEGVDLLNWCNFGKGPSFFFNSMSIFFPHGERYFINAVRKYEKALPNFLKDDVSAFIGQEAIHGREHSRMNFLFNENRGESFLKKVLEWANNNLPSSVNLANTIALEHLTAILAETLINLENKFDGSEKKILDMWLWHAVEEIEHKAVAFDVFDNVIDSDVKKYTLRATALVVTTFLFLIGYHCTMFVEMIRNKDLTFKTIKQLFKFYFTNPSVVVKIVPLWFEWFKPSFHPWKAKRNNLLNRRVDIVKDRLDAQFSQGS